MHTHTNICCRSVVNLLSPTQITARRERERERESKEERQTSHHHSLRVAGTAGSADKGQVTAVTLLNNSRKERRNEGGKREGVDKSMTKSIEHVWVDTLGLS